MAAMMPVIPRHKRMVDTRTTICAGVYQSGCEARQFHGIDCQRHISCVFGEGQIDKWSNGPSTQGRPDLSNFQHCRMRGDWIWSPQSAQSFGRPHQSMLALKSYRHESEMQSLLFLSLSLTLAHAYAVSTTAAINVTWNLAEELHQAKN